MPSKRETEPLISLFSSKSLATKAARSRRRACYFTLETLPYE